jgi:hypothetical protein
MPKREKTPPPPDDEPRYLVVVHPYPLNAHLQLHGDRRTLALWLACCIGKDVLYAMYHKPSVSQTCFSLPSPRVLAWRVAWWKVVLIWSVTGNGNHRGRSIFRTFRFAVGDAHLVLISQKPDEGRRGQVLQSFLVCVQHWSFGAEKW